MAVMTIAMYASPPSSDSTPHFCSINAYSSYDFNLNGRSSPPASSPSLVPSTSQRPIIGGLTCRNSGEQEKGDDQYNSLSSFFRYSNCTSLCSSLSRKRDQSPISVLSGPVSVSSSCSSVVGSRISREIGREGSSSFRINTTNGLFNGF